MTPRGRLPRSWGDSPPDKLAGCTIAFFKMLVFGFIAMAIGGFLISTWRGF